jgi:hypothetical protein
MYAVKYIFMNVFLTVIFDKIAISQNQQKLSYKKRPINRISKNVLEIFDDMNSDHFFFEYPYMNIMKKYIFS